LSAEERLRAVESEVEELNDKQKLLTLTDPERHPFPYLTLEMNLTKSQVREILNLMAEAEESLLADNPMQHRIRASRI
jgi:hypothetical protein